jgi:hypothetical protein
MSRYSCAFNGTCEQNEKGQYATLEECEEDCSGRPSADLSYIMYQYAPDTAVQDLAPHDQREVLRQLTGVTIDEEEEVAALLESLGEERSINPFFDYPDMYPFLEEWGLLDERPVQLQCGAYVVDQVLHADSYPGFSILAKLIDIASRDETMQSMEYLYKKLAPARLDALKGELGYILEGHISSNSFDFQELYEELEPLNQWILTHHELVPTALRFYTHEFQLPFVVQAYEIPELSEVVLHMLVKLEDVELIRAFVAETGVAPSFDAMWEHRKFNPKDIEEILSTEPPIYTKQEVRDVLSEYEGNDGNAEAVGMLWRYVEG